MGWLWNLVVVAVVMTILTTRQGFGFGERVSISGPSYHIIGRNQSLALTCTAHDFTTLPDLTWSLNCTYNHDNSSANSSTCMLTPHTADDGKTVTCSSTWNTTFSPTSSYIIALKYPPDSVPVITGLSVNESFEEGSNVTLNCTVRGGKPPVSDVNIVCKVQGQTLTFPYNQTDIINTTDSVSRTLSIENVGRTADGAECQCSGSWSPDPDLYSLQSAPLRIRILHLFTGADDTGQHKTDINDPDDVIDKLLLTAYIGSGAAAFLLIVVTVSVIVWAKSRRRPTPQRNSYERPAAQEPRATTAPSVFYSNLELIEKPCAEQTRESELYDNAAVEKAIDGENKYMNLDGIGNTNGMKTGGLPTVPKDVQVFGGNAYENVG